MKVFLVALKEAVKKDYPNIDFDFHLSRRSRFAHMGLNLPLISIPDHLKIIKFIQDSWQENKEDDMFSFCSQSLNMTILYLKRHRKDSL